MVKIRIMLPIFFVLFIQFSHAEEMMQAFRKFGIIKPKCSTSTVATNEALVNALTAATCAAYTRMLFLKVQPNHFTQTHLRHQWRTGEKANYYYTEGFCAQPQNLSDESEYVYQQGANLKLRLDKQPNENDQFNFYGRIGRKSIQVTLKNVPNILNSCQMGQQIQVDKFQIGSGIFDFLTFPYGLILNFKEYQSSSFQQEVVHNKSLSNTSDYEGFAMKLKFHQIQGLSEILGIWSPENNNHQIKTQFFNSTDLYSANNSEIDFNSNETPSSSLFETIQFRLTEGCTVLTAQNNLKINSLEDCHH